MILGIFACSATGRSAESGSDDGAEAQFAKQRQHMVDRQIEARNITDQGVLAAMRAVPRHRFVPAAAVSRAYKDHPLVIGHGQTISQPYIVALMTELARPQPKARALDVGTGSGYQAAVLSGLVEHVYSVEIVCPLADDARTRLDKLGYANVTVRCGDGYGGWPEQAPFDLIIVAAAPAKIPQPLIDQLKPGGRLIIPVGTDDQVLTVIEKAPDGSVRRWQEGLVRFVPMTGKALDPPRPTKTPTPDTGQTPLRGLRTSPPR